MLLKGWRGTNLKGMRGMSLGQFGTPSANSEIKFDTQLLRRRSSKVVIQETPTRRFWQRTGIWTSNIDKATSFQSCSAAMEQATNCKLQNVQLVLTREITECEIIPLKASFRV
jgi:hypothetical protein